MPYFRHFCSFYHFYHAIPIFTCSLPVFAITFYSHIYELLAVQNKQFFYTIPSIFSIIQKFQTRALEIPLPGTFQDLYHAMMLLFLILFIIADPY